MEKSEYRFIINNLSKAVNMSSLLKEIGVDRGNYIRFMSGNDGNLSISNLEKIYKGLSSRPLGDPNKTDYTVQFYKLVCLGGCYQSDGTTIVSGYQECFTTNDIVAAIEEYNDRKEAITADNMLGVELSMWRDDEQVDDIAYTSEDILAEEVINEMFKED